MNRLTLMAVFLLLACASTGCSFSAHTVVRWIHNPSRRKFIETRKNLFLLCLEERGREGDDWPMPGPIKWSDAFWIEASAHCFLGFRAGFNPVEFVDFLLGWFGVDFLQDDDGRFADASIMKIREEESGHICIEGETLHYSSPHYPFKREVPLAEVRELRLESGRDRYDAYQLAVVIDEGRYKPEVSFRFRGFGDFLAWMKTLPGCESLDVDALVKKEEELTAVLWRKSLKNGSQK